MLDRILDLLSASFVDDASAPSVVLSKLPNGKYYGSLVRYTEPFGQGKSVVYKCTGATSEDVLKDLHSQFGG